ncbi:MAG: translocation/assembly module TamB domain-containing protein [Rhodobacteraceae bacterium]|nr:translocation/assembly module TamB domain-containing protein [Paracoccaceae bacterium]
MRWWLVLVLICAPFVLQAQETAQERADRGTITAFLEDNLSGAGRQVVLRGFKGALSSRATATQLTVADDQGIWLTLNDIVLDWNRAALLSGRVSVNALTAAEIIIDRAPASDAAAPSPEAAGFALPELPVAVEIAKISAPRVVLGPALLGQQIEGSVEAALSLSGGDGSATLHIDRTNAGPSGQIDLAAGFNNATRNLALSLDASEAAGGVVSTLLNLPGQPSVDLVIKGEGPLSDFAADLALKSDGVQRLAGTITLTGAEDDATRFAADVRGDIAPLFAPAYADFLGNQVALVTTGSRSATGRLDLTALDLTARALTLRGQARIAPDGLPEGLALTGTLGDPTGQPVLIPGFDAGVSLQSARLDIGYDSATGETWRAAVDAEGVTTPNGTLAKLDLRGSGRIARLATGNTIGGTLTLRAEGVAPADPALAMALGTQVSATTRLSWQQGTGVFRIGALDLTAGPIALNAGGQIAGLSDGFRTRGRLRIDAQDLAPLSGLAKRALSGRGTITVNGEGSPLGGDFDATMRIDGQDLTTDIAQLDGLLRGPSSITVDARRDTTGTVLRALTLRAGGLAVDGKGTVTSDQADLDLTLAMADLSRLGPEYGGAVQGALRLTGPLTTGRARIVADLSGTLLRLGQPEADRLLQGASSVQLTADLNGDSLTIERLSVTAPSASATASGLLAVAGSDLTARVVLDDLSRLRPGLGGRVAADATFKGTPATASITLAADASGLRIGQPEVNRVLAGASRLTAALRLDKGAVRLDALQLNSPNLTAQATGRIDGSRRQIDLTARLANLGLLLPEFPGVVSVTGTAVDTGAGYDLTLSGTGPGQIGARVTGRLAANLASADLAINGSAQAGLANPFLGDRVVSGPLALDLRLNGPLALSSLSGRVVLSQGRLADPALPFSLQDMEATATLGGGRAQVAAGANVSSGGRITVTGPVTLTPPFPADLAIGLSGVVVRDPQLYETRANGDLRFNGPLTGGALISGRVALPQTELRIAATGLGGAGSLDELRHIGDAPLVRETRRRAGLLAGANGPAEASTRSRAFGLDVEISAPNQMFLRGRGLDAELGGTLRLTGTTDAIVPSGAFNLIRGRLDILARRLTLTEAYLQLQGDFDPMLRVVASSSADGVTTAAVIEGNATDPQVSFTSNPALPQEEILAQLLFGRRLENLSALQALQLANAVATLAGRGGEGIIAKLRKGFGLDDFDVQTADDGTAQLTAGKYLSEKVYSEVVLDQDGKSQINLNLDLTDNITVKGRVGDDGNTGVGVFFEKDY